MLKNYNPITLSSSMKYWFEGTTSEEIKQNPANPVTITADGKRIPFTNAGGALVFTLLQFESLRDEYFRVLQQHIHEKRYYEKRIADLERKYVKMK